MNKTKSILFLASLFCSVTVWGAQPNDAEMSRLLIGEWQGGRHAVQYMHNGTWRFDPVEGTTHGKWKIKDGHLIETWRFVGEKVDSLASFTIVTLDGRKLVLRDDKQGEEYISTRMNHPLREDSSGRIVR